MRRGHWELSLAAVCGAAAGLGFGWHGGWVVVSLAFTLLLSRLALWKGRSADEARHAGGALAVFVLLFYGIGHIGLPLSIEPSLRAGTLLVVLYFALAQAAAAYLSGCVIFRLPVSIGARLLVLLPAFWLAREWASSRIDVAVPWLAVGYAQAPDGPLAPLFPLGGVFLVSWVSLIAFGAVALAVTRELPRLLVAAVMTAAFLALAASSMVGWTSPSAKVSVELMQSGAVANDSTSDAVALRTLTTYASAIAASRATLIVTPQFAIPKTPGSLPPGYLADLDERLAAKNADALLGMYFESSQADEYYNGVASLGASGHHRYLKQHLFPFGEYLPFPPGVRRWINAQLTHPRANAARGPVATEALFAGGLRVAVALCYEIAFGDTLRMQAMSADALVNIASEGTHSSFQLVGQSKQIAQARALEFQKPLVRTSDVRGTFFMDSTGRITDELPDGIPGTMTRTVEGRVGLTPYARWGDMLALGLSSLCVLALLAIAMQHTQTVGARWIAPAPIAVPSTGGQVVQQRGQVLPVALGLLVIVAGFFYFMVNTGQTVTEKIRVTNAADAAAYSAAVVEARALNYDAYLNRGMLANQMAIAQMVSFASWIDYFATAADNFGSYVTDLNYFLLPDPRVAVLDVAFGGSALVAAYFGGSTVHEYADYIVDYGAGAIITVHDVATQALSLSQIAVQANLTGGIRQGQIADQVVKAMDPNLNAEVVLVTHGFDLFTKNYGGNDRDRFADVAMRSRGAFTRERDFTISSFDIPLVRNNGALKKRGGTDLVGLDEWRGVNTLELHGQRFFCGRFGLSWCDDIKTPIGWGAIEVDAGGGDAGHGYHGNAYNENPTTADKADSAMRSPTYGYYTGIPRSQEVADTDPKKDESTSITILVTKSQSDTLTSGNAATLKPSDELAVFDAHPAGGKLAALGRAQVYFDRIAARADGKTEMGSLYNPYWRVRLVAPTLADRTYASTKQGGLQLPSLP